MTLRQQTVSGVSWSALAKFIKQLLSFIVTIILARLIPPEDFGLIGMIAVFTGFASLFSNFGFSSALIQNQKIEERHLSSVFWLNILVGAVLTCLMILAAPFLVDFYDEPQLYIIAIFLSLNFLIGSLNIVQKAILLKQLNFKVLAKRDIAVIVISGLIAVIFALNGYGVMSLVWQSLSSSVFGVLLLWRQTDWRPKFIFNKSAVRELFKYSANLFGFNAVNYWLRSGDNLLIGKFLGSYSLGIYGRAYSLMLLPIKDVSSVLAGVMFPVLSKIQDDKVKVKKVYLSSISVIALFTFPMMMGLFVVSDIFVLTLYGEKWLGVIPLLQILSMVGLIQSVVTTVGWIYTSQGRTDWMFKWGIFASIFILASFVIGILLGSVESVAKSYAVCNLVLLYPVIAIPGKLINLKFMEVVKSLSSVFLCSIIMAIVVYVIKALLVDSIGAAAALAVCIIIGGSIYFYLVHVLKIKPYLEAKEIIQGQIANKFRGKNV